MKKRKRCPWCGEETMGKVMLYNTRSINQLDWKCSLCGNLSFEYSPKHTFFSRICLVCCKFSYIAIMLYLLYVFYAVIIAPLLSLEKYTISSDNYGKVFVGVPVVVLLLNLASEAICSYMSPRRRVSSGTLKPPPFDFSFRIKVKVHEKNDDGYRFYKWRFADNAIFGGMFKTDIAKYKGQETAIVIKNAEFLNDRTVLCTAGFVLGDRIKGLAKPGLEFTLINQGKRFASGIITEMLPEIEH